MQTHLARVAAWLITLLLVATLAAVIIWTAASEPETLALPTPILRTPAMVVQDSATGTPRTLVAETPAPLSALPALEPPVTATTVSLSTSAPAATVAASPSPFTPATEPATETATMPATEPATATLNESPTDVVTATAPIVESEDVTMTMTPAPAQDATATRTPAATVTPAGTFAPTVTRTLAVTPGATVSASVLLTTVQIIELLAPTPTPPALPDGEWQALTDPNQMNDLVVISNTVWIAGSGGALAWSKGSNTPVIYTSASGLSGNHLAAVANCALPGFGVVFGGPSGLQIGEPRTGRWRQLDSSSGGMRYDDVSALYCDAENDFLIVGYAEHGIDIYDLVDDEWQGMDRNSGLAANDVRRIGVVGDREQIWVVSDDGVTLSAGADSTFYDSSNSPLVADRVGSLAVAANEAVWLGGEGVLYRVEGEDWTVYTAEEVAGDFPTELITGLAFAPDGSLWLGSSDAEICRFDVAEERCIDLFAGEEGMAPGPLTNLVVDATGSVYYSTAGNGYAVYDGRTWRTLAVRRTPLVGNLVKALAVDAAGVLWAATEAGVQQLVEEEQPTVFDAANSGISPLGVRTLQRGAESGIWVGGRQGASFFDGEEWQTLTAADGLASDNVQAITVDGEGRTWFGGDRGISIWNGSSFFVIDAEQGLPSEDIRSLAADAEGVWIGTAGGGLYRFESNQLQLFNSKNVGLPSDTITALAVGDDGVLWIGTDRGLAQLARGAVTSVVALDDSAVRSLAVTAGGEIWVALDPAGVFYGSGSTWIEVGLSDGLPAATITAIAAGSDQVWLGGQEGGIGVFTVARSE